MKKTAILFLILVLGITIMAGCQNTPKSPKADFSFQIPDGYTILDATDTSCSIVSNETVVGGIILTQLNEKDLNSKPHSDDFYRYMDSVAGPDLISEYILMGTGDKELIEVVNHMVTDPETDEVHNYQRLFFVRNSAIYDMWFDMEVMDENAVKKFYPSNTNN